jgi:hypothetical protein
MTRAVSPTHLGGIGLMLEVAHVCPRCGKRLSEDPSATNWHLNGNGCRPVVYAALPEPEGDGAEDDPPLPAGRQIHDFEAPTPRSRRGSPFVLADPMPAYAGTSRALAIPWLRPPDLGEAL